MEIGVPSERLTLINSFIPSRSKTIFFMAMLKFMVSMLLVTQGVTLNIETDSKKIEVTFISMKEI